MSEAILELDMVGVAAAIRAGEVSSLEVTRACLDRIERLQPHLNAFIALDSQHALEAAQRADQALARSESIGPLHGVPLAHKDLVYRRGRVSTGGSKILRGQVATHTATALARLDNAGALDLGTLNMSEFAAGGTGHNEHYGDCINPWSEDLASVGEGRATGGSSSGSGVAVAARMLFGALGSDTGGSVRLPAALCGVVGLKPSEGRISKHGVIARSWSMDTLGPLTRSVRDSARLLSIVAGRDANDPTTSEMAVPDYEVGIDQSIAKRRIGVARNSYFESVEADVDSVLKNVAQTLEASGAEVVPVDVPDPSIAFGLAEIMVKSEAAALHEPWLRERPEDYSIAIRSVIEAGLFIPAARYLQAVRLRAKLLDEFCREVFSKVDAVLLPATPMAAPLLRDCDPNSSSGAAQTMAQFPRFTRPFSYLGLPVLCVPGGFSEQGLPISFQLVGAPFNESLLLNIGHRYQQETNWHLRAPPLQALV
jgi:aspartyl-tRNA(Asn)/glutamyl-tRNA(Gln) amidotransferase subunit A